VRRSLRKALVPAFCRYKIALLAAWDLDEISVFQLPRTHFLNITLVQEFTEVIICRIAFKGCSAKFRVSEYNGGWKRKIGIYENTEDLHFPVLFTHISAISSIAYSRNEIVRLV